MKPCSNNRELLAWLALDALDVRQEQALRAHLETCEGCRGYLEEISNVTEKLSAATVRSDIQTSESFHRKLANRLRAEETVSGVAQFRSWLNWLHRVGRAQFFSSSVEDVTGVRSRAVLLFASRLAFPVISATVILVAAFSLFVRRPDVPVVLSIAPQTVLNWNPKNELDPTISNYRMVANQSLDKLDELLTRQGNRNPSPTPIYTASTRARANAAD